MRVVTRQFYQPEYQPPGLVARAGSYAPEAGLATAPYLIGFVNGMTALVEDGLSSCRGGFGRVCATWRLRRDFEHLDWSDGRLSVPPAANASEMVAMLDLLLTGGRLNALLPHHPRD